MVSRKKNLTYPVETEVITYKRKKVKGKRLADLDQLPQVDQHHELLEEDCVCQDCSSPLKEIGSQRIRREVVFIPATLECVNHIQHSYKCLTCSQKSPVDKIIKADLPKPALNHSLGSSSVIAHVIYQKLEQKVPTYRQESFWQNLGLSVTRRELSNWLILSNAYYFAPLSNLLLDYLRKKPILHADETTYNVLESSQSTNYIWTVASSKHRQTPIIYYRYDDSRSGQVIRDILGDFQGYLQADMYSGYQNIEGVELVGCWAHARRYFHDACPKEANKDSLALQGKQRISAMFKFEKDHAHLSGEELLQARAENLKPMMDDFFDWCRDKNVLKGSKLAKAFNYCLNHEEELRRVLTHPQLVLDNNLAERQVKEWVIGRKNWLFSSSRKGAESLASIKTILETAKANGLNVEKYLRYLLDHLPNELILTKEVLEAYLPWNEGVQEICKQNFIRQQRTNAQKQQQKAS